MGAIAGNQGGVAGRLQKDSGRGEEKDGRFFEREPKNDLLEKALRKFKDAANRQIPQLRALASQLTEKADQRALAETIEEAKPSPRPTSID